MADRPVAGGLTMEFAVGGMTCAACAVRVETRLRRLGGVTATVNYATQRARVVAPPGLPASALAAQIERAGYTAELIQPAVGGHGGHPDEARAADLRRRLLLAGVFFFPLSDLSVLLSLFPGYRFTGWQWVLLAMAAPVAGWAAWPFHAAAVRNARHATLTMDTLVSLGIVAACGWSVYAMFVLDRGQARVSAWQERGRRRRACWPPTAASAGFRSPDSRRGSVSWSGRGSGSSPTGRWSSGNPRWTPR